MPLLNVESNEQLLEKERQENQKRAEFAQNTPYIIELAAYFRRCWESALSAKRPIEIKLISALMRRNGVYSADKLAEIDKFGGSKIYMMLTDEKCNAAEAWIEDILLPADDMPWGIDSTPVPELSSDQMVAVEQAVQMQAMSDIQTGFVRTQEDMIELKSRLIFEVQEKMKQIAKEAATKTEEYVKDVIVESNWRGVLKQFISDLVTFKAAFIEGPIVRNTKEMQWDDNGEPIVEETIKIEWDCISPFDVYPSATSRDIDDGYLITKHRFTRSDLNDLIGTNNGYDDDAIRLILERYGRGGLTDWLYLNNETQRADLEGRHYENSDPEGKLDALRMFAKVQGLMLLEYGMTPEQIEDPFAEYAVEIWMIGSIIFKCVLNSDPLGRIRVFKTSYRKRNGSFWGDGLPELIKDSQDMCNAAARNLTNNMAISSGPQVGVDISTLPPGSLADSKKIYPWKVWGFDMKSNQTARPPVWFFQPNVLTDQLIKVYEFFSKEADNKSGIPRYGYGGQQGGGGALSTATGFSMMMTNVSKGVKKVISNIDDVIEASIRRLHQWLMLYDRNPILFQGDVKIVAKGSSALIAKEQQQIRRQELLQILLHPTVYQIIGPTGLAEVLRKVISGVDINVSDVIPSKTEMERFGYMQMMEQQQGGQGSQNNKKATETNMAGDKNSGQDTRIF